MTRWPEWAVYLTVVPATTILAAALPYIGRNLLGIGKDHGRAEGALEAYKAIAASLGFVLAFTLVQADGRVQSLNKIVTQEAAAINTIDRSLLRFGSDEFTAMRAQLRELVADIPAAEWPALADGRRSPRAEAIVDMLSRRIRTTEGATPRQQALLAELITKLDEFTDRREELINGATERLPDLFWTTVAGILLVMGTLALFISPTHQRILTLVGITAASMLIMCLILITDAPFSGGATVSVEPLEKVGQLIAARQKDPPSLPVATQR